MSILSKLTDLVARLAPGCDTFAALSARCGGAWPGEVAHILRQAGSHTIARSDTRRLLASAASPGAVSRPRQDPRLPLPHPLDHDWRFTTATSDALLATVRKHAPQARKILFVCAPTAALRAAERAPGLEVVLAGRAGDPVVEAVVRAARGAITFHDLAGDMASVRADAAVLDPPWYDDIALPLLARTAAGLKAAGLLLACHPDRLTGAADAGTFDDLRQSGARFGLSGIVTLLGRVRYETPLFEARALAALDLAGYHPRWRTGRVFVGSRSPGPVPYLPLAADAWTEKPIQESRTDGYRVPIGDLGCFGCVVPSVSRQHSARRDCLAWTSGNRALGSRLLRDDPPGSALTDTAAIIGIEIAEAGALLDWGPRHWHSERTGWAGDHASPSVARPRIFHRRSAWPPYAKPNGDHHAIRVAEGGWNGCEGDRRCIFRRDRDWQVQDQRRAEREAALAAHEFR